MFHSQNDLGSSARATPKHLRGGGGVPSSLPLWLAQWGWGDLERGGGGRFLAGRGVNEVREKLGLLEEILESL